MEYIYKYFDEKAHITIYSPKPEDLTTSNDIRAILLDEYPKLRNDYFIVSVMYMIVMQYVLEIIYIVKVK
ncbi:hypothetical protein [Spiroplasma endosymbiont of Cleonymus obscurus]|uniref:hypothetical protein n=1 Tax=Spiroplasma endosymbiont of Cleonymus obscurus TaxID=3066324 RepID=UPI0037DD5E38